MTKDEKSSNDKQQGGKGRRCLIIIYKKTRAKTNKREISIQLELGISGVRWIDGQWQGHREVKVAHVGDRKDGEHIAL